MPLIYWVTCHLLAQLLRQHVFESSPKMVPMWSFNCLHLLMVSVFTGRVLLNQKDISSNFLKGQVPDHINPISKYHRKLPNWANTQSCWAATIHRFYQVSVSGYSNFYSTASWTTYRLDILYAYVAVPGRSQMLFINCTIMIQRS